MIALIALHILLFPSVIVANECCGLLQSPATMVIYCFLIAKHVFWCSIWSVCSESREYMNEMFWYANIWICSSQLDYMIHWMRDFINWIYRRRVSWLTYTYNFDAKPIRSVATTISGRAHLARKPVFTFLPKCDGGPYRNHHLLCRLMCAIWCSCW